MKILLVGSDKVYAIENNFVKYLSQLAETRLFPAQTIFYDHYNHDIFNKISYRLGISPILRKINHRLKEEILAFRPDIIWAFKGMEIFPSTWEWVREQKILLVNYNPDNPFIFSGKGSGNKNVTGSIGLFDLHFTYNYSIRDEIEKKYRLSVAYLPFGFEISAGDYAAVHCQEEIVKLCFLGNPDGSRALFIRQMADAGIQMDVYGNDWKKFVDHPNVRINKPVYGLDFWRTLFRYRVQLNLMRVHNQDSHNMRSFEVPGVGGILLAPSTPEHELFFTEGKEAFFYHDVREAVDKTRYLLGLSTAAAGEIRMAARQRSITSHYSYRDRTVFAYTKMKELLNV